MNSDAIFHTEVIYVEADGATESSLRGSASGLIGQDADADVEVDQIDNVGQNRNKSRNQSGIADHSVNTENVVHSMFACMIFLTIYLAGASYREERNRRFLSQLEKGKRRRYECAGMLAAATPMMLVGIGLSCLTILQSGMLNTVSGARVATVTEIGMVIVAQILKMLLLIAVSILFTACAMCIWRKDTGMLSALPALLLLQIIICPVFFDMAVYVPAMRYIRYLCPVAYYL